MPSAVALLPARQGSKRVPGKNIRVLAGHPVLAYTIAPAIESGVFDAVPGGDLDPEPDEATANGATWLLARQT